MKFNQALTQTLDQFISTAKGTSSEWLKFALENPLTQEVKTRYPESLRRGSEFVETQTKQISKLLNLSTPKTFTEKKEQDTPSSSTQN